MNSVSQPDHDESEAPTPLASIVGSAEGHAGSDLLDEIQTLEKELESCKQTVDALTAELTSRETQISAILSSRAWRWVCRYSRIKHGYLIPAYEFLSRFYKNGNAHARKDRRRMMLSFAAPRANRLEAQDELIVLLPVPRVRKLASAVAPTAAAVPAARADVICFSIVDWNFRYQRPQQIISQFAAHGHRVFTSGSTGFCRLMSSLAFRSTS